jgi:S-methyl-5-thioribose-1-phosphate isomerase
MLVNGKHYRTVWMEGRSVKMINQLVLPYRFEIVAFNDYIQTADAIKNMVVRGAGAIGAAAGFGMAQAVLHAKNFDDIKKAESILKNTRPTAQNLFYAIDRVLDEIKKCKNVKEAGDIAVKIADEIANEDAASCKKIGEIGSELIKNGFKVSTHCNAGWLAFVDWGTALSPVYFASRKGKKVFVYADETRPRCQGAKLTAWELAQEKIPHAIIADNATGYYMRKGEIDLVFVGADRIAANGDFANKIGTYEKAVLAKENGIPFYVAAPLSTIDLKTKKGDDITVEERSENEVLYVEGLTDSGKIEKVRISSKTSRAKNPAFDITLAKYITGIITPKGIFPPGKIKGILKK